MSDTRVLTDALGVAALPGDNAPIGVFDSGFGGLTVARELIKRLPHESMIYFGDSARCPYGPRSLDEVRSFVLQICAWLVAQGVKLIVIACNTATAAGLVAAQQAFSIPIVGVVEPGARAAVRVTHNRRVGVIATKATIESCAYSDAIRHIDAGITVFSTPAPRFVDIAEQGVRLANGAMEDFLADASKVYVRSEFLSIAREYLDPLRKVGIDTLVLGCTHYPLLKALIGAVIGREVVLISSAEEAARDVKGILTRKGTLASADTEPSYRFVTTSSDVEAFRQFGSRVLNRPITSIESVDLDVAMPLKDL